MQELGVLDSVLEILPASALIMTSEEDPSVMSLEDVVETDILLSLDSGCYDHIVELADAPGYAAVLHPSPAPNATRSSWPAMETEWRINARSSCA